MTVPFTNSASYDVGYGKPPRHTQFQKGRSGNPGGRPRKPAVDGLQELALKEAYRTVVVEDGGMAVPVPVIQAVLRSQMELAAAGNVRAQHAVLTLIRDIELVNAAPAQTDAMSRMGADRDAVGDYGTGGDDDDFGAYDDDDNDDGGGIDDCRFDDDGAGGGVDGGGAAENGAERTQQTDAAGTDRDEQQAEASAHVITAPLFADRAPPPDKAAAPPAAPQPGDGGTDPGEMEAKGGEEAGMTAAPGTSPEPGVGAAHASPGGATRQLRRAERRRAERRRAKNRKFPVAFPVFRETAMQHGAL